MSVYPAGATVHRGASLSNDGLFRYTLVRDWTRSGPYLTFVMLNPSIADAQQDDPTIRRCVGFARSFGFGALRVVNLYAYRATKPADLWLAKDRTGGDRNEDTLREVGLRARHGDVLIAAWGAHAKADRVAEVLALPGWDRLKALGVTKSGAPRHPLYLSANSPLTPWSAGEQR